MARQLDRLYESDAALEPLRAVIAARPVAPFGAVAQAQLQLGEALDRLGYRTDAVAAYRAALAALPSGDPLKIGDRARAGIKTRRPAMEAMAYRCRLQGWRAFERGAVEEAARALAQSLALRPTTSSRSTARLACCTAQKNDAAALILFESVARDRAARPPTIYAARLRRCRTPARATRIDGRVRSSCTRRRAGSSAPINSPETRAARARASQRGIAGSLIAFLIAARYCLARNQPRLSSWE
jgi:tetratricopeptide (TPR) repeat protein